jgi:hypothetical protein
MKIAGRISKHGTVLQSVFILAVMLLGVGAVHRSAGQPVASTPVFAPNYELAGNQFTTDHSLGVTCANDANTPPNNHLDPKKCISTQGEPAIRADRAGNFYGSSESVFCVIGGQCSGTYAWKSGDGGAHFKTLPLPNTASAGRVGVSPAGGDTDIAVAPVKNGQGVYNVYVASLDNSLASIDVSTSTNGGGSWIQNPASALVPADDREWIAADGASKVCISYHSVATGFGIQVDCSYTAGLAPNGAAIFTQHATAFDTHASLFTILRNGVFVANNQIGNLAIDPSNHVIYQVWSSVSDISEIAPCVTGCNFHTVWIGVSTDGGSSFTDYIVYDDKTGNSDFGHAFVNVSVDKAGNIYVVYSDDHNIYYSVSRNFGQTWSPRVQINKAPSNTAIYPWAAAGSAGELDVVWYGTSYCCAGTEFGTGRGPTYYPQYDTNGNPVNWYVYFAQNVNALSTPSSFVQVAASGVIHRGDICELGAGCGGGMNRDLLDDFGVAASPTTGMAAIIYTSDQHVNSALEPANTYGSRPCTSLQNNGFDCIHTNIAVQTGGSGINQPPGRFEVDDEDFEELDLSNNGGHSPHNEIDITNTGTASITKFDIAIGGLPWTVTWNTAAPIQVGQTVHGTSTSVPLGLLLAVGNVYQLTVTATLADGTTETQRINAIYTLGAGLGL